MPVRRYRPINNNLFRDYSLVSSTASSSSGAVDFDIDEGNAFEIELDENVTSITISNPAPSGDFCEVIIKFKQDDTGSRTVAG